MIIRVIAVDPDPPDKKDDLLVYQIPEHSRELALLLEMLDERKIEHTILPSAPRKSITKSKKE